MKEYETYILEEWNRFVADVSRARANLEAVAGIQVRRVLDIGCGGGQELIPFVQAGAFGVGSDPAREVGGAPWVTGKPRPAFIQCLSEHLPFRAKAFDVVICRIALPYMDNRTALGEMARVLCPGGRLLLKIHAAPYYLHKFRQGLKRRDPLFSIHAVRVLLAGFLYHVLGFQVRRIVSNETFQSEWLLKREFRRMDLRIRGYMPDNNPLTPSLVIEKTPSGPKSGSVRERRCMTIVRTRAR